MNIDQYRNAKRHANGRQRTKLVEHCLSLSSQTTDDTLDDLDESALHPWTNLHQPNRLIRPLFISPTDIIGRQFNPTSLHPILSLTALSFALPLSLTTRLVAFLLSPKEIVRDIVIVGQINGPGERLRVCGRLERLSQSTRDTGWSDRDDVVSDGN